jgi:hypothetical protein
LASLRLPESAPAASIIAVRLVVADANDEALLIHHVIY